jgi:hypothetical protein
VYQLISSSGVYKAVFQDDGNWVVYHGSRAIWASNTSGNPATLAFSGSNGRANITVPIASTGGVRTLWSNNVSNGTQSYHMVIQNDGNLVEYTGCSGVTALWATNTVGR